MSAMKLTLHIWRQRHANDTGTFETHVVDANEHMSFLEMLDVLNQVARLLVSCTCATSRMAIIYG